MARSAGDTVLVQEVRRRRVRAARPMTVVRDESDLVALWFPIGPAAASELRDIGLRAVDLLRRGDPPFHEPGASWRPDPGWASSGLADEREAPCR